jgi:hypothetical protein
MLCKASLVWFRFFRRKTHFWIALAIAASQFVCSCGTARDREKVRMMLALARINFVGVLEFMNELLW